ncbi:hypothetical protein AJ88_29510 [Mesorhizobium amorphae CCBAU 01583]|nr:hypothetical protein AJ88_29510 [Mesorhizobium amorphae CCBAU 01583]
MLISPALEFMLVQPDEFEPLHWALELPSLAAVRLRTEGVSGDALREKLAEVEHYAMGDYLTALASGLEQGGRLASQRVAEITGLPLDLVQRISRVSQPACSRGNLPAPAAKCSAPMTAQSRRPTSRPKAPASPARTRCSTAACRS